MIARAMGIALPLDYCFLITPLVLVVQLFPSINGFGVRESAFIFFFRAIELSAEQAVSLSFVSTGVIVALSLVGGIVYATRGGKSVSQKTCAVTAIPTSGVGPPEEA
jgi:hypothetical protein